MPTWSEPPLKALWTASTISQTLSMPLTASLVNRPSSSMLSCARSPPIWSHCVPNAANLALENVAQKTINYLPNLVKKCASHHTETIRNVPYLRAILDCPRRVIGSVIGNDDDGTTGIGQQLLHEGNKLPGVHLVLDNAKAHVSTGTHCGDQFQGETISAVFDHRRLSDRCPGAPTMVITAHRRFIDEVNLRPRALRQSPQLWKRLIEVTLQF